MAVRIGSDEFTGATDYMFEEESEKQDPEELKRKMREIKPVTIPERRIPEFLKGFDCVVVNEFGDDYHLSEEEREKNNKFYKTFKSYIKSRKRCRTIEEFVETMRLALKCLDDVAEDNGFYDPTKFKLLFLKGEIDIYGLKLPKLVGRMKKIVSWDYITEFILSDEPIENLNLTKSDKVYSPEELEEAEDILFDDIDNITKPLTEEEELEQSRFYDETDDLMDAGAVLELSDKEIRKLVKYCPEFLFAIKETKRDQKSIRNISGFAYNYMEEDYEDLNLYGNNQYMVKGEIPEFKGDILNDDDYYRYMRELEDFEETKIYEVYCGKYKSKEQIREIELRKLLESEGYNLRNFYENKEREKKLNEIRRKEKKKEKKLRERLTNMENRRKKRSKKMGDFDIDKKKKKKKKEKSP